MDTKERKRLRVTGNPARRRSVKAQKPKKESDIQIQYTPAKPFNRNRFLLRLATVAAVVLALVFGMSIFFKTQNVTVSGAVKYTPWEIKDASGIQDGDALLGISEAKIVASIRAKLPYVADVRVGIKLPDTVMLEITELEVVYAIEDNNAAWWLMDAKGRIVDSTDLAEAKNHTRILGVRVQNAVIGEQAVAFETQLPEATGESTPPTLPPIPAAMLLSNAVEVLTALEKNGVMGTVDTVNVTDIDQMILWYENRYKVTLGDSKDMVRKIGAMKAAILKMGQYQTGILDVSFSIWPNEVGYSPFEGNNETKN